MHPSVDARWREVRRSRLLGAAARVFARQPYGEASMDGIAQEAGVGKPTLYRYFPSKEALFAAVFAEALDELEARLAAVLRRERDVEARLAGLVEAILPVFRDHLVPLRSLDETAASAGRSRRRAFRDNRARISRHLATVIDEAAEAGTFPPGRGTAIAELLIGMIRSAAAFPAGDDREVAHLITDLVLRGLLPRPSEALAAAEWTPRRADLGASGFLEGTGR